MARLRCPNDGMAIPQVAAFGSGPEAVGFSWCWSCRLLSAYVGDPGTLAAMFAEDGRGGWQLFRAAGDEHDVNRATAVVSQVGPQSRRAVRSGPVAHRAVS